MGGSNETGREVKTTVVQSRPSESSDMLKELIPVLHFPFPYNLADFIYFTFFLKYTSGLKTDKEICIK